LPLHSVTLDGISSIFLADLWLGFSEHRSNCTSPSEISLEEAFLLLEKL
jgi:hypothetical protein